MNGLQPCIYKLKYTSRLNLTSQLTTRTRTRNKRSIGAIFGRTHMNGTFEQSLPQPFLKVLFKPLQQERGSKGAAPPSYGVETQHKVRFN